MQIRATSRPRKIYGGVARLVELHLPDSDLDDSTMRLERCTRTHLFKICEITARLVLARFVFRFASSNRPVRVNCTMEFLAYQVYVCACANSGKTTTLTRCFKPFSFLHLTPDNITVHVTRRSDWHNSKIVSEDVF